MNGKSKTALKDKREIELDKSLEKILKESPNTDKLLRLVLDDRTIIYCKDEEQLERARAKFSNFRTRKYTLPEE